MMGFILIMIFRAIATKCLDIHKAEAANLKTN